MLAVVSSVYKQKIPIKRHAICQRINMGSKPCPLTPAQKPLPYVHDLKVLPFWDGTYLQVIMVKM